MIVAILSNPAFILVGASQKNIDELRTQAGGSGPPGLKELANQGRTIRRKTIRNRITRRAETRERTATTDIYITKAVAVHIRSNAGRLGVIFANNNLLMNKARSTTPTR